MKKIWSVLKNKEVITYLIFGVATTVINFIVFTLLDALVGNEWYLVTNTIAWVVSVLFAYITNKLWVFESKSWKPQLIFKELLGFVSGRVLTLLLEQAGMFVCVDLLGFGKMTFDIFGLFRIDGTLMAKVFFLVVVIVLNYIFSKLWVFKKNKTNS